MEKELTPEQNLQKQKEKIQAAIDAGWMEDYVGEVRSKFQIKTKAQYGQLSCVSASIGNGYQKQTRESVQTALITLNKVFFDIKKKRARFCKNQNNVDAVMNIIDRYFEIKTSNAKNTKDRKKFIRQRGRKGE